MNDFVGLVVRFTSFIALLGIIGAVAFRLLVLPRADVTTVTRPFANARAANIGIIGAAVLLPVAFVKLLLQTAAMRFADDSWIEVGKRMALETDWGHMWVLQCVTSVLLIGAFAFARRNSASRWVVTTLLVFVLIASQSLSGHAMSPHRWAGITVFVDAAHLLGAGLWLGTLGVMYSTVSKPASQFTQGFAEHIMALLSAFSPLALFASALVALSGLVSSFAHLEHLNEFVTTQYGITILAKVASVGVVALFGFRNWKIMTPLVLQENGAVRMTRAMRTELLCTLLVLLVTAVLVVTGPPMAPGMVMP
ncbi:MAG: CopD family protein [Gemmatimonadaceae bacterium]